MLAGCGAHRDAPSAGGARPLLAAEEQLVVVVAAGWDETSATLRRWQRPRGGGAWRPVGEATPVVVGRSGLAWGRGRHGDGAPSGRAGPIKLEGDGRTPAGVYRLSSASGYDAAAPPGTRLAYAALDAGWVCVDDPASSRYNEVFDAARVAEPDWSSAEVMRRDDELYRLVVVVDHNAPPAARKGAGSCIFLHVWDGPDSATAGCTAMPLDQLTELTAWLDPERAALVVLTSSDYEDLRAAWGLPLQ